jgi:hypothetical protein
MAQKAKKVAIFVVQSINAFLKPSSTLRSQLFFTNLESLQATHFSNAEATLQIQS